MWFAVTLTLVLPCLSVSSEGSASPADPPVGNLSLAEFQSQFKHRRMIQLEAIKGLLNLSKYEAKYEMVSRMLDKIYELHLQSWPLIENSGYIPGGEDVASSPPLPNSPSLLSALSTLMENCALVGDVVLRLPDIATRLLRKKPEWMAFVKRDCLTFVPNTRLLDPVTEEMLTLAAQELQVVPRSPDFINPYREPVDDRSKQRKNDRRMEL